MRDKIKGVTWLLLFICYGMNLMAWGGVSLDKDFGTHLMREAPLNAPLSVAYIYVGHSTVTGIGLQDYAGELADRWFGQGYPEMRKSPGGAIYTIFNHWSTTAKLNYYGVPMLIFLLIYLRVTTTKKLKTLG